MAHFVRVVGFNSVVSLGSGQYSLNFFFEDPTQAKFLRIGDEVTDSSANKYLVDSWVGQPSDFTSASSVTVTFATNDVLPVSAGFDATSGTPGQVNLEPEIKTVGSLGNISVFSGQNFEYNVQASWSDNTQANLALVGDSIVDSNGKEFTISFLDVSGFSVPFRVVEKEKVGQTPAIGTASLYRSTSQLGLFQGDGLSDTATDIISGRDAVRLDTAASGDFRLEVVTLTATHITNKSFPLVANPLVPNEVEAEAIGGGDLVFGPDFTVTGNSFSWTGLTLDGFLEAGDQIEVKYFS